MSRNPFKLKIEKVLDVDWSSGRFLDYDQSNVDPRFFQSEFEEEKKFFQYHWLGFIAGVVLIIILAQLVNLQIVRNQDYLALAEGNRLRIQKLLAPRGIIYDSSGIALAKNIPGFELVVTPLDLPDSQEKVSELITQVSEFFSLDRDQVAAIIATTDKNSFYPVSIKQIADKEKAVVFVTQQTLYPGFSIQNNPQREYLNGPIFAHILGYPGKLNRGEYEKLSSEGYLYNDVIGKTGIEAEYEKELRGILGERLVEVDAQGTVKNTFQQKDPLPGNDLYLSVDYELQEKLFNALSAQLLIHRAKKAAAVALDPKTGNILALVSLPSFDNNWFSEGISDDRYKLLFSNKDLPLFNRVISGTYPPGSTVKPLYAVAALEEGIVDDKIKINDTGSLVVPNQFNPALTQIFHGWNPAGLGYLNIYEAIAKSSDIYFYTIGGGQEKLNISGLGPTKLAFYLRDFFLGEVTGIDLPTEKTGLIPTPDWKKSHFAGNKIEERWYLGDTYNMSIGQGFLLVTPLQLAVATAAIANEGTVYKPHLVSKVIDRTGNLVKDFEPEALHKSVASPASIKAAQEGMRLTVTWGTAKSLSSLEISSAGKTGTSQFDSSNLSKTHAWFTAYAPYADPKIVLTVLIEAGGEGSGAAVPVAKEVFDWYSKNRL